VLQEIAKEGITKEGTASGEGEASLGEVLKSIRGAIDNPSPNLSFESDDDFYGDDEGYGVLELTNLVSDADLARTPHKNTGNAQHIGQELLEQTLEKVMRPLVKEWLQKHLPRVVEKVVTQETRRVMPKS